MVKIARMMDEELYFVLCSQEFNYLSECDLIFGGNLEKYVVLCNTWGAILLCVMTLKLSNKSNILGTRIWNNNDDGNNNNEGGGTEGGAQWGQVRYRTYCIFYLMRSSKIIPPPHSSLFFIIILFYYFLLFLVVYYYLFSN